LGSVNGVYTVQWIVKCSNHWAEPGRRFNQ
jgi:hypothetical protein